jgi:hypothetical protein
MADLEPGWAAPVTEAVNPRALRVGGVLAQFRRGAQGRPGHAAGRLPGSVRFALGYPSKPGAPYPIRSTAWPLGSVTGCTQSG